MPPRDWKIRISDILGAIDKIARYTANHTRKTFEADDKTVDAVLRNITIIGEATTHVPEEVEARLPTAPWSEMRGMRNIVVHEYFGVDFDILWETVQHDLPPLVSQLQELLDGEE